MEIFNEFTIEAAHHLPNVGQGHPCARMHGHSFGVAIHVKGALDHDKGWVIDYAVIQTAFARIHEQLDHRLLNEIEGLENPTAENLARWIWDRMQPDLDGLCKVIVKETATTGCVYEGPE